MPKFLKFDVIIIRLQTMHFPTCASAQKLLSKYYAFSHISLYKHTQQGRGYMFNQKQECYQISKNVLNPLLKTKCLKSFRLAIILFKFFRVCRIVCNPFRFLYS